MVKQNLFSVMLIIATIAFKSEEAAPSQPSLSVPGCPNHCGEVEIPYPFGITPACYLDESFRITCNNSFNPNKPFVGQVPLLSISIETGEFHISNPVANYCFNADGDVFGNNQTFLETGQFTVSTKNVFTVIGCNTVSVITGLWDGDSYMSGCASFCSTYRYVRNGSCSGVGCCQTTIPGGLKQVNLSVEGTDILGNGSDLHSCGYSFIVEESKFDFSTAYLPRFLNDTVPVVLEWTVGNETCERVVNKSDYACKGKSSCFNPENMSGYRCMCLEGFSGNPYLPNGCQDIDECDDPSKNNCTDECINTEGSYECSCPKGHYGNGRKDGTGCVHQRRFEVILIILGVGIGIMILLVSCSWFYIGFRRWKLIKLKENFFQRNGGLMLKQQLSIRDESSVPTANIFTAEELQKITDNYSEDRIVGKGGFGTVYKGILSNGKAVAIKKSKILDKAQSTQFINEVIVLSQINHRNAVRLLGCCLEEEVPLLVYEFISNGTLFDHIHDKGKSKPSIPWKTRLKIASETAGVLSYLHSSASVPIIHRDVKSTNILLDDNYTAKVSDFGASKLVPLDQAELSTIVQGTLGYLDPEYLQTSQLTEKSDVYSFGVVLAELMTGKVPLSFSRPEEERNLSMYFLVSLKEGRVREILDSSIANDVNNKELKEVSTVVKRCLRVKGEERPSMKEVAAKLEGLYQTMIDNPWDLDQSYGEESEVLLSESNDLPIYSLDHVEIKGMTTSNQMIPNLHSGR